MSKPTAKAPGRHGGQGQLRIIGGEWRSRRFVFPDGPGLRPTPDRVRETLFNWLAPYVEGARVLDPFAGSGALFLEALSRGAREGLALDTNGEAVAALRNHLDALKCGTAQLVLGDAVRYLGNQAPSAFDLVFLDPPFHQNLLQDACRLLETRGWLNPDAWIYTESESVPRPSACPETGGCTGKRKPATYITRSGSGEPEDEPGFREHSPTPAGAWRALRGATRRRLAGRYRPARRAGAFLPRGRPTRLHPGECRQPIFLPSLARLWQRQAGYRWHGISGERLSGWQDDWLVVADQGADPFILETGSGRILFDLHGGRGWDPAPCFDDLWQMAASLACFGEVWSGAGEDILLDDCSVAPRYRQQLVDELQPILGSRQRAEDLADEFGW